MKMFLYIFRFEKKTFVATLAIVACIGIMLLTESLYGNSTGCGLMSYIPGNVEMTLLFYLYNRKFQFYVELSHVSLFSVTFVDLLSPHGIL